MLNSFPSSDILICLLQSLNVEFSYPTLSLFHVHEIITDTDKSYMFAKGYAFPIYKTLRAGDKALLVEWAAYMTIMPQLYSDGSMKYSMLV